MPPTEAIVADVSETSTEDSTLESPVKSSREEIIEGIRAKQAQRQQTQPSTDEEDARTAEPPTDGEAAQPGDETPPVYRKDGKWVTKRKVNGVEEEVDYSQLLASHQKNVAADRRLEEANRREKELAERERRIAEQEAQRSAKHDEAPSTEDAQNYKDLSRRYTQALYEGEEDEAAEILDQMLGMGRQAPSQPLDVESMANQVEQRLTQKAWDKEVTGARTRFQQEFSDISESPELWSMADRYTAEIMSEEPGLSPYEIMARAGAKTREWVQSLAPAKQSGMDNRTERKRAAASQSAGAPGASVRSQGKPAAKPMSASERIAAMRQARGLS
jgi:NAD(P)H-hydrate repair Nnr-like enzyme with NAD(P)H-hydrate epimerase domain